jgi:hypothetical protein
VNGLLAYYDASVTPDPRLECGDTIRLDHPGYVDELDCVVTGVELPLRGDAPMTVTTRAQPYVEES